MRALWTKEVVDFHGRWHHISHAGINPLPVQRPIPLWLGGGRPGVESVIERIGRLADGWFPQFEPDDVGRATLERMHGYARAAGRDPASIGIEGRVSIATSTPDAWAQRAEDCRARRGLGGAGGYTPVSEYHACRAADTRCTHCRD